MSRYRICLQNAEADHCLVAADPVITSQFFSCWFSASLSIMPMSDCCDSSLFSSVHTIRRFTATYIGKPNQKHFTPRKHLHQRTFAPALYTCAFYTTSSFTPEAEDFYTSRTLQNATLDTLAQTKTRTMHGGSATLGCKKPDGKRPQHMRIQQCEAHDTMIRPGTRHPVPFLNNRAFILISGYLSKMRFMRDFLQTWKWDSSKVYET